MARFASSIRAKPAAFALRFLLGFAGATLIWLLLAPAYAAGMAAAANMLTPLLETDDQARYSAKEGKVVVLRTIEVDQRRVRGHQGLFLTTMTWNTSLLAGLILATPGWSPPRRIKALCIGVGILAASHFANIVVNILYTQFNPPLGTVPPANWSSIFLEWLSRLFDMMAAGLLLIVVYVSLVAGRRGPTLPGGKAVDPTKVGPNTPCPCDSGLKFKNCCRT